MHVQLLQLAFGDLRKPTLIEPLMRMADDRPLVTSTLPEMRFSLSPVERRVACLA